MIRKAYQLIFKKGTGMSGMTQTRSLDETTTTTNFVLWRRWEKGRRGGREEEREGRGKKESARYRLDSISKEGGERVCGVCVF